MYTAAKPLVLTVGDDGITIAGDITQLQLGQLQNADLANCSVKFSLLRATNNDPVVNLANATIVSLDAPNNAVKVSYRLQSADVAKPIDLAFVRWRFTLPDGGKFSSPADDDDQMYVRIKA